MRVINKFLFVLFALFFQFATVNSSQNKSIQINSAGIENLELCYSTIPDVTKNYGVDFIITYDRNGSSRKVDGKWKYCKAYWYKEIGLKAVKEFDSEYIEKFILVKPFNGMLDNALRLKIGKTKLKSIYQHFQNIRASTSEASDFWDFSSNNIRFFVKKNRSIQTFPFKESYYLNKPITKVEIDTVCYTPPIKKNSLTCKKPMYAPKSDNHLNCYKNTDGSLLNFIKNGDLETSLKQGVWKSYYSNHTLKEIGKYNNNNKAGKFKYFNEKGELIKSEMFNEEYSIPWMVFLLTATLFLVYNIYKFFKTSLYYKNQIRLKEIFKAKIKLFHFISFLILNIGVLYISFYFFILFTLFTFGEQSSSFLYHKLNEILIIYATLGLSIFINGLLLRHDVSKQYYGKAKNYILIILLNIFVGIPYFIMLDFNI